MFTEINKIKRLASLANLGPTVEPQRAYMYDVTFYGKTNPDNTLKFYLKNVSIPGEAREPIVINIMDDKFSVAGRNSGDKRINITFWDDQSLKVMRYFQDWIEQTGNYNEGDAARKRDYIREAHIQLKDTSDLIVTGKFIFTNCYPIEIGEVSLSYDASDIVEVQVSFTYDDRIFQPGYELDYDAQGILQ